jgi:hypothetical protein
MYRSAMMRPRASRASVTVSALQIQDRGAELTVAEDVLDPTPKVPAPEMTLHDIVALGGQRREQVPNRPSAPPRRTDIDVGGTALQNNTGILIFSVGVSFLTIKSVLAAELVALRVDVIVAAGGTPPPWPPSRRI